MGVEYRRYLIPKPNSFKPSPEQVAALVEALRRDRWIVNPTEPNFGSMRFENSSLSVLARETGYFVRSFDGERAGPRDVAAFLASEHDSDLLLSWPVESLTRSGLRYPLEPPPFETQEEAEWCYHKFQLHVAGRDYIYHSSEAVDPFDPSPVCSCGAELEYWPEGRDPLYSGRLFRVCPECGAAFDPTDLPCVGHDGYTGEPFSIPGGVTYRFAVVVDCGKCFGDGIASFKPDLRELIEKVLGTGTYEAPDVY
jgi:hypothetical protein